LDGHLEVENPSKLSSKEILDAQDKKKTETDKKVLERLLLMPQPIVALPCGSISTINTRFLIARSAALRLTALKKS
jgi:hypothetical protein